jgi:hypothetical protein
MIFYHDILSFCFYLENVSVPTWARFCLDYFVFVGKEYFERRTPAKNFPLKYLFLQLKIFKPDSSGPAKSLPGSGVQCPQNFQALNVSLAIIYF